MEPIRKFINLVESAQSVEQLAHISDKALDDAYHYGRSTPGANFGWLANIESAKAAKRLIDAGETDIEKISDAIHDGWNITAMADYNKFAYRLRFKMPSIRYIINETKVDGLMKRYNATSGWHTLIKWSIYHGKDCNRINRNHF